MPLKILLQKLQKVSPSQYRQQEVRQSPDSAPALARRKSRIVATKVGLISGLRSQASRLTVQIIVNN